MLNVSSFHHPDHASSMESMYPWGNTSMADVYPIEPGVKVMRGHDASPGEFPHQVYLSYKRNGQQYMCSASIIHPLFLLTAAHCVFNMAPATINLVTGEYDLSHTDGTEQHPRVSSIIIHENYDARTLVNDIAILVLQSAIKLDNFTNLIKIPEADQILPGWAHVSGWGTTGNGRTSDVLQTAKLAIISTRLCRSLLSGSTVTDGMICAGTGDKDVCAGDSGGPLTCEDTARGQKYLCGIVSWGYSCEHKNEYKYKSPGVYTDVRKYHGWIENHTTAHIRVNGNKQMAGKTGSGISSDFDGGAIAGAVAKSGSLGDISLDTFPHQLSLQDASTESHICSVTLIHPLLLLTAAHCVFGKELGRLKAATGNHHHLVSEPSRGILEAILHPNYDNLSMDNDIALLRLDRPVPIFYNGSSITARLPQPNWSYLDRGILTGWGISSASSTEVNGTMPVAAGTFEAGLVRVDELSVCVDAYGGYNPWNRPLTQGMLCAGYSGDDSCKEIETAAVLMCQRKESGRTYICGIGSWGYGCGSDQHPMVYTHVSKYRSWISKEMRKVRRKQ